jgi:predicted AAA+ superfamily ATPase
VDFVIRGGKKIQQLIQVYYNLSNFQTKDRELHSLIHANKELSCKKLILITMYVEEEILIDNKKISIIPVWKWLLEKKS